MRAKVRFDDDARYGGLVTVVLNMGHRSKIGYDDGTEEVSGFPGCGIIIDDENNGSHLADAETFVSLGVRRSSSNPKTNKMRTARPVVAERGGGNR